MNIIIPLGGLGQRFKNAGYRVPKPLLRVADRTLIEHVINKLQFYHPEFPVYIAYNRELDDHGFQDLLAKIASRDGPSSVTAVPLTHQTRGAVESVLSVVDVIRQTSKYRKCLLLNGDTFYTSDIAGQFLTGDDNLIIYTHSNDPKPLYSYLTIENDYATTITEKVKVSDHACTGVYCFADLEVMAKYFRRVVDDDVRFNGEYYISCAIHLMLQDGHRFKAQDVKATRVFNLGTPEQLTEYLNRTYCYDFDLDGTLVITDNIYLEVWRKILGSMNLDLTMDIFNRYIKGNNDLLALKALLPSVDVDIGSISRIKDELFKAYISEIVVIDGALEFLQQLYNSGHVITIVTNCNRSTAELILSHTGLGKYVGRLIVGSECPRPKPYPDPYLMAYDHSGLPPERHFIFEDSRAGLISATSAKPACVVGLTTSFDAKKLKKNGANVAIDNYQNLEAESLTSYGPNDDDLVYYLTKFIRSTKGVKLETGKLKGGYICDVIGFTNLDDDQRYVIKMESTIKSGITKNAKLLDLYTREYYFYSSVQRYLDISTPRCLGILKDNQLRDMGIILENMYTRGYTTNLDLNSAPIEVTLAIISQVAKLHAQYWGLDIQTVFKELRTPTDPAVKPVWGNYLRSKFEVFRQRWQSVVSPVFIELSETAVARYESIQDRLAEPPLTICHGDVKSPNIFYRRPPTQTRPATDLGDHHDDRYDICFIDWQYVSIGKGTQDLVFFLIESFEPGVLESRYQVLTEYYYHKLIEFGVRNYDHQRFVEDLRLSALYYPLFVAVWFGSTPRDELIDVNFPFFYIQRLNSYVVRYCQGVELGS